MTNEEIKKRLEKNICLDCGSPILDENKYFCKDCYNKANENIKQNGFSNDWDIFSLINIIELFGWNGD